MPNLSLFKIEVVREKLSIMGDIYYYILEIYMVLSRFWELTLQLTREKRNKDEIYKY